MLIVGCDFHPEYRPTLTLDLAKAKPLLLDAYDNADDRGTGAGH
jgi:hypothetical protein